MKYVCRNCAETFSSTKMPKYCPFCLADNIGYAGKAREKALEKIDKVNKLTAQIDDLMQQYKPLYLEREYLLGTLRTQKHRGIITEEEMPKIKRYQFEAGVSEYRKKRREEENK